jgi:hypothetical protein
VFSVVFKFFPAGDGLGRMPTYLKNFAINSPDL